MGDVIKFVPKDKSRHVRKYPNGYPREVLEKLVRASDTPRKDSECREVYFEEVD